MTHGSEVELQTNKMMTRGTSFKIGDDVAQEDTCHPIVMSLMKWKMLTPIVT